jgi:hypothetical protein
MRHILAILCSVAAYGGAAAGFAATIDVNVPGTSDPWLSGMPPGSMASQGDVAPAQSPVEVVGIPLLPGAALTFEAKGRVANGSCGPPYCPSFGPDGGIKADSFPLFHGTGAENGISDLGSPINALLGVFLGPDEPDLAPPPATLDFNSTSTHDYLVLRPLVQQAFFIGDGHTRRGLVQQVIVPDGATRLFLGTADGCCWYDNRGSFRVRVTEVAPP